MHHQWCVCEPAVILVVTWCLSNRCWVHPSEACSYQLTGHHHYLMIISRACVYIISFEYTCYCSWYTSSWEDNLFGKPLRLRPYSASRPAKPRGLTSCLSLQVGCCALLQFWTKNYCVLLQAHLSFISCAVFCDDAKRSPQPFWSRAVWLVCVCRLEETNN
jgi:hypothetical protein